MAVPYEFTPQYAASTSSSALGLPDGPLPLEVAPDHYIDLAKMTELDDNPKRQECYVLFSTIPSWEGKGPHGVLVKGEARDLVLTYWRLRAARTRAILTSLLES